MLGEQSQLLAQPQRRHGTAEGIVDDAHAWRFGGAERAACWQQQAEQHGECRGTAEARELEAFHLFLPGVEKINERRAH